MYEMFVIFVCMSHVCVFLIVPYQQCFIKDVSLMFVFNMGLSYANVRLICESLIFVFNVGFLCVSLKSVLNVGPLFVSFKPVQRPY